MSVVTVSVMRSVTFRIRALSGANRQLLTHLLAVVFKGTITSLREIAMAAMRSSVAANAGLVQPLPARVATFKSISSSRRKQIIASASLEKVRH